jgi:7-cyano-7-deazaguanine reductase
MKHIFDREKTAGIVHCASPQMDTITMTGDSPPGQQSAYPDEYAPELLLGISRSENRATLGLGDELPFQGVDIWNAWELTWLTNSGQPNVATLEIRVPAESPRIIESKSLKLYLNSFSMSRYEAVEDIRGTITADLSRCVEAEIEVSLLESGSGDVPDCESLPGDCIDDLYVECQTWDVDASLLEADAEEVVSESLHSHLLRSLCPVTSQPDSGSVLITYEGPRIDRPSLLRYIASFRQHQDFHETCVERMFLDIKAKCEPSRLSVYARYQRRGGIDINPFRSDCETEVPNTRLWRQ